MYPPNHQGVALPSSDARIFTSSRLLPLCVVAAADDVANDNGNDSAAVAAAERVIKLRRLTDLHVAPRFIGFLALPSIYRFGRRCVVNLLVTHASAHSRRSLEPMKGAMCGSRIGRRTLNVNPVEAPERQQLILSIWPGSPGSHAALGPGATMARRRSTLPSLRIDSNS